MSDIPPDLLALPPGATPILSSDQVGPSVLGGPQWGIFKQTGEPLIAVDSAASVPANSTESIDYARDYRVSDYPQEKGAFQSYNKVQVPFQAKVGFLISTTRTDFLNAIEAAAASLDIVTVVTPEIQYASANIIHYAYRRDGRSGRQLIRVDVWCEEIRISGGVLLSSSSDTTQSPNAAPPTQSGPAQPIATIQNPPTATDTSVGGGFTPVGDQNFTPTSGQIATSAANPGVLNLQGSGPGGFMSLPNLPPGVPNSTGGGASSVFTDVGNALVDTPMAVPF